MKIYTRIEFDSMTGKVLLCESFDYYGPLTLCTGVEEGAAVAGSKAAADTAAAAGTAAGAAATGAGAGTLASAGLVEAGFGLGGAGYGAMTAAELGAGFGAAGAGAGLMSTLKDVATIASPVSSAVQALSAMDAAKGMGRLSGVPQVTPLAHMPSLGDLATMNAMRANLQQQLQRRGRVASILTSPTGDKLGG